MVEAASDIGCLIYGWILAIVSTTILVVNDVDVSILINMAYKFVELSTIDDEGEHMALTLDGLLGPGAF